VLLHQFKTWEDAAASILFVVCDMKLLCHAIREHLPVAMALEAAVFGNTTHACMAIIAAVAQPSWWLSSMHIVSSGPWRLLTWTKRLHVTHVTLFVCNITHVGYQ
jgi:hypothetical protein